MNRLLNHVEARFPKVWDFYAHVLEDPSGLPEWPNWCFVPVAGAATYNLNNKEGGWCPWLIACAAAWRVTRGIYRFDPTVFESLTATGVGKLPVDALMRLPEWCVYVETPGYSAGGETMEGFYAYLEFDLDTQTAELRLMLDYGGENWIPYFIHLIPGGTVEDGLKAMLERGLENARKYRTDPASVLKPGRDPKLMDGLQMPFSVEDFEKTVGGLNGLSDHSTKYLGPLISLLLYLCSEQPEIFGATPRPDRRSLVRKTKAGKTVMDGAKNPQIHEVAFDLGRKIRDYRKDAGSGVAGGTKSPHIRRAHWHSFWSGPKAGKRELTVRWLPPIPVKIEGDAPVTIRKIDG
jgi:hypothetical protein